MPIVTIEINGERTVLDGRLAQLVVELLRVGDKVATIPVGHVGFHFDGRRVHPPELTERVLRVGVSSATG